MSTVIFADEVWQRVMADPKLQRARSKLSFDEIRMIIAHALPKSPEPPARETDEPVAVRLRYERAQGRTLEEMRANLSPELYGHGDTVLVWANEGDLLEIDFLPFTRPQSPKWDALVEALLWIDHYEPEIVAAAETKFGFKLAALSGEGKPA
jgi:hypothetical protein